MFELQKALYGLKQAPRAWYERLSKFLLENGLRRVQIDKTLFTKTRRRISLSYKFMLMIYFLEPLTIHFARNFPTF